MAIVAVTLSWPIIAEKGVNKMRKVVFFTVCMLFLLAGGAQASYLYLGGSFSQPIYSIVNGKQTTEGGVR
jgi:hypothetical protein